MEENKLSLAQEVEQVFSDFAAYREESKRLFKEHDETTPFLSKQWRILSVSLVFLGIFLVPIGHYLKWDNVFLMIFYLVILFGSICMSLTIYTDMKSVFRDETLEHLRISKRNSHIEVKLLESFSNFSIEALQIVSHRLKNNSSSLQFATNMLVGSLAKVGMIPAVIAILVAISKLESEYFYNIYFIVVGVLGIYLICMKFSGASMMLSKYCSYVDFHIKHMRN